MLDIGLESIDFQVNNKFGDELTNEFQKVFDYKKKIISKFGTNKNSYDKIFKFYYETTVVNLPKIVKKYTNVNIIEVVSSEDFDYGFAIIPSAHDDTAMYDYLMVSRETTGLSTRDIQYAKPADYRPLTADELQKLANSLNKKTGKLSSVGKLRGESIKSVLFWDPYSSFFLSDTTDNKFTFTAKELTAILLHEVGHVISFIEHCADVYFRTRTLEYAANFFNKNASIPEKIKMVKYATTGKEKLSKLPDILSGLYNYSEKHEAVKNKFSDIITACCLYILAIYLFGILSNIINGTGEQIRMHIENTQKRKTGDMRVTTANIFASEYDADNYVVRHGYAEHLVSGLNKFNEISAYYKKSNSSPLDNLNPILLLCKFIGFLFKLAMPYRVDVHGTNTYVRTQTALKNLSVVFKNADLPDALRKKYIEQYENTMRAIERVAELTTEYRKMQKLWNFINYLIGPSEVFSMIYSGRFTREFDKHVDEVSNLVNNPLFYYSAKITQASKK